MARESNAQAAARLATVIRVAESRGPIQAEFATDSGLECQCGAPHGEGLWGYQWRNDGGDGELVAHCATCYATTTMEAYNRPRTIEECKAMHVEHRRHWWAMQRITTSRKDTAPPY